MNNSQKKIKWTPDKVRELFKSVNLLINESFLTDFSYSKSLNCVCLLCGNETKRSIKSIKYTGTKIGCQKCSMKEKSRKSQKSEAIAKQILKQVGLKPLEPYPGSQVPWRSECIYCSRTISRPFSDIQHAIKRWGITSACPYCNGNRVDDLERLKLLEKLGLIPLEKYINNKVSHLYRCAKCGASTRQTYINIKRKIRANAKSFGCPQCSFDQSGGRRAMKLEEVRSKFKALGLEIIGPYKNARILVDCICLKCNRKIRQTLNGVNNGKSCRFCSPKGIRYGEPSYLYLIENLNFGALKVGIGNYGNKNDRLHVHLGKGWVVIQTWHFQTAEEAKEVEQKILNWLLFDLNLSNHLTRKEMPQGGHSETVSRGEISGRQISKKINQLIQKSTQG
jgi:hypothetical protein